jgi:hypothetical protein
MKTDIIKYNVRERGRTHRGQDRHFDCIALAAIINGPAVQEQVKNRDLYGYFGHWPRIVFGMNPVEGGIVDGKPVHVEPALITTMLRADQQGNVEHQAEFLQTVPGKKAALLYQSKTGGFSSAIDTRPRTGAGMGAGMDVPTGFYGFDYVLEPNFHFNRGHTVVFDSANAQDKAMILDFVVQEQSGMFKVLSDLYDRLHDDYMIALDSVAKMQEENESLLGMLASAPDKARALLDSAGMRPRVCNQASDLDEKARRFLNANLAGYEPLPTKKAEEGAPVDPMQEVARRMGL